MENDQHVTESPAPDSSQPGADDELAGTDPAALLAAVIAERDQLAAGNADLLDRFLRRAAEFENFRRRAERERGEISERAGSEIVRELLPILDDFERALKVESADREFAKGIALIYQRLLEVLQRSGLEPLPCAGQKFDPHLHHAVETAPTAEVEDQTILEEKCRGYNFRGRLLRPAMVKVAVKG
jgi:molecular chaperone GrpE